MANSQNKVYGKIIPRYEVMRVEAEVEEALCPRCVGGDPEVPEHAHLEIPEARRSVSFMADRGRVGVGKIASLSVRQNVIARMQNHHRHRLQAIRGRRKGGKEDTLDNTVPVTSSLSHLKFNAKKAEMMRVRENDVNADNNVRRLSSH